MDVTSRYLDSSGREDRASGGARRIRIDTPAGSFSVWTKRIGNNPDLKVLLLHGGPGATHGYLEACGSFLPPAGSSTTTTTSSDNPRYMELLVPNYYEHHTLRMSADAWPDPVQRAFAHINPQIYVSMQGPSELGMSADAKLAEWDRVVDLEQIAVLTLVIGARHDTMDPAHMEMMARLLPRGRYLYCPEGSHMAMYDDQETYFAGLVDFLTTLPPQPG